MGETEYRQLIDLHDTHHNRYRRLPSLRWVSIVLLLKRAKNEMLYLVTGIRRPLYCTLLWKAMRHHPRRSHVLVIGRIHFEANDERNRIRSATRILVEDRTITTCHHTMRNDQHVSSTAVKISPLFTRRECWNCYPRSFLPFVLVGVHSRVQQANEDRRDREVGWLCYLSSSVDG